MRRVLLLGAFALVATAAPGSAQLLFDGNILWDNYSNGVPTNIERTAAQPAAITTHNLYFHYTHNDSVNPLLTDPNNHSNPNFVPLPGSPAIGGIDDVVDPVINPRECDAQSCNNPADWAQLERVCYRGALPPANMGQDWTQGWTYFNDTGAGRSDINYNKPVVMVQGDIVANTTWTNTNNYLLRGRVNVDSLVTLTIQPGTVIFGESGTVPFLCIQMGGKINAVGTPTQPIVLTSDQQPGNMAAGDIAGIVLNGLAIANCADCLNGQHCLTEGTTTFHCGTNDCDSSGDLRYFRSEYAGHILSPDNELNSITFCSVGMNTRLEYLESFRGLDDLFEWFGGKNTVKRVIGIGGGDDCLDTQMGYRGQVQFLVAQSWGDHGADKGCEWDNNEFNVNAPCRNNPVIANCTFVCTDHTTGTAQWGIHLRRGTSAQIYNSIIMGWKKPGLYIQDNATATQGFYPLPPVACPAGQVGVPVEQVSTASTLAVRATSPVENLATFYADLPQAGNTRLEVYDLNGRIVHSSDHNLGAGRQTLAWNARGEGAVAGVYFYRVESQGLRATGRLVVLY